ncbi:alpha/beta fold hydrolase [Halocatena pleomorpha]|uniref:Alpha/beta hydrolase n=1 Tax=Halocatena pleomorpha TaxID=1785090 RepID=A0A3P3RKY4_9EURY|nr:alpha/beta hydrolase [Halocatena pleomorpha]RRJ33558.1 alpha/beta hydrolase [Halocatena pleomorpha]
MQTVHHNGRETGFRRTDFGDGKPVVYVHGSGGTHNVWVNQYGSHTIDRPAVALDLSGHGESEDIDTDPGVETIEAYADDVGAVVRSVDGGVVVGNSLGGAVALWLVLERDVSIDGLVLCGTGAKLGVNDGLLEMLASDLAGTTELLHGTDLLFHDADADTESISKEAMRTVGLGVLRRDFLSCDDFDVRDRLKEVSTPCLAITGEHDQLTPVRFHEYLAENLPNCQRATVPDAAHLSMIEQPERWNDTVRSFVETI